MSPQDRPSIGALVAAIVLPPLGVYLARGIGPAFWICIVLTLLWWAPGVIFALVVLLAPNALPRIGATAR